MGVRVMTRQIPNVRTWSKTVPSYLFTLRDLDVYVLKQHDDVLRAMGRARAAGWRLGDLPEAVVIVVSIIAPAVGITVWGGRDPWRRVEVAGLGELADDVAAWCFAIALLGPPLILWRWWRSRRHWDGLEVAGIVTSLVAGILTLGGMASASGVDVLGFAPVSLPVWLTVALAALVGASVAVASRGRRVPFRRYFQVTGAADPQRVGVLVDALEPRRREKLLDERRRAIARLRDRGLIDAARADAVRSLPLGLSPTIDVSEAEA